MIPANDFGCQWRETRLDLEQAFNRVLESGWYILGEEVRAFEVQLAQYWGMRYAAGVASGLDAIEISLRILGCKCGDKVLTTPLSAFATTLAILKLGAEPVFVDTDNYGLVDLDLCRRLLSSRPDIRFFVPVHLYGNCLDLGKLRRLREEFSLSVVEDCAQAIGASFAGERAGTVGQFAALSLYPTKNLGAIGDGGAILTNDALLDRMVRMSRDYGQASKYQHEVVGYNSRLDELQAALLRSGLLPRLPAWNSRRQAIAGQYLDAIRNPALRCIGRPAGSESCWHLFPVLVEGGRKAVFLTHLKANNVTAGEHYPLAIPYQQALAKAPHEVVGDCAQAREFARCEVSLPMHPYLTDGDIQRVVDTCNRWRG
jgi:dTDP-3-amino-3,4,6-trideoxy-alpha-D-glucose transaminase